MQLDFYIGIVEDSSSQRLPLAVKRDILLIVNLLRWALIEWTVAESGYKTCISFYLFAWL
jgi:hypothetical protein